MGIVSGCVAGVLGLTGLSGLGEFELVWAGDLAKLKASIFLFDFCVLPSLSHSLVLNFRNQNDALIYGVTLFILDQLFHRRETTTYEFTK